MIASEPIKRTIPNERLGTNMNPNDTNENTVIDTNDLSDLEVSPTSARTAFRESLSDRKARMSVWWSSHSGNIYKIGRYLAVRTKDGRTIAERLVAGETFTLTSIKVAGRVLPLAEPLILDTASFSPATSWLCVVCHSAHGTGIAPSKGLPNAKGLEANEWYYNAAEKKLCTISSSCYTDYCAGQKIKAVTKAEPFFAPVEPVATVEPVAPVEPVATVPVAGKPNGKEGKHKH